MPINNNPIFSGIGDIQAVTITAGNTKSDGAGTIGTDIFKAFTADATYGSYVSSVRISPFSSVAATTTTATVIRVFISSVTTGATTSANTFLIAEMTAAAQVAASSTTATYFLELPINKALPPGYTILVTSHAGLAANTGWEAVVFAGKYTAQA